MISVDCIVARKKYLQREARRIEVLKMAGPGRLVGTSSHVIERWSGSGVEGGGTLVDQVVFV